MRKTRGGGARGGVNPGVQCLCQAVVAVGGGVELEIGRIGIWFILREEILEHCVGTPIEIFQV